jgi:hypothetical protein
MKIKLYERNVYGNVRIYFRDPEQEKTVSFLTGQKTISETQMMSLEALGCEIEIDRLPESKNK